MRRFTTFDYRYQLIQHKVFNVLIEESGFEHIRRINSLDLIDRLLGIYHIHNFTKLMIMVKDNLLNKINYDIYEITLYKKDLTEKIIIAKNFTPEYIEEKILYDENIEYLNINVIKNLFGIKFASLLVREQLHNFFYDIETFIQKYSDYYNKIIRDLFKLKILKYKQHFQHFVENLPFGKSNYLGFLNYMYTIYNFHTENLPYDVKYNLFVRNEYKIYKILDTELLDNEHNLIHFTLFME